MSSTIFLPVLILSMISALWLAAVVGLRRGSKHESYSPGLGPIRSVLFSLFGLLSAFAFNGAANRHEMRQDSIREEGISMRNFYLQLEVLPLASQQAVLPTFWNYVDLRFQQQRPNRAANSSDLIVSQNEANLDYLWKAILRMSLDPDTQVAATALQPTFLAMFDARSRQILQAQSHPPEVLFVGLGILGLVCSFYVGYGLAGQRRWSYAHLLAFSAVMGMIYYLTIDFEFPQLGYIQSEARTQFFEARVASPILGREGHQSPQEKPAGAPVPPDQKALSDGTSDDAAGAPPEPDPAPTPEQGSAPGAKTGSPPD